MIFLFYYLTSHCIVLFQWSTSHIITRHKNAIKLSSIKRIGIVVFNPIPLRGILTNDICNRKLQITTIQLQYFGKIDYRIDFKTYNS